jgi:class 3 adenylate cyclase/tetratricopeptide (TPR) repeat protein
MSEAFGPRPNPIPTPGAPATSRDVAGERRIITVLFCDVVGSTSLASRFDPEEWAEIMNEAFRYLIAPVEEYGGMVARLMGDAVLAFFGAPLAHEDDPQRAVLAGLGIINGIRPFIRQFEQDYGLEFNVRVGINTGPVVVGEMGTGASGEYTAMGDAINLAARMEQTAAPGTVQITEDTYRLIAPLFDVWDLGGIEVKGKDAPVQAYRVLGLEPQPGRLRGLEGIRSPLIGREREIARLREILTGLRENHSRICYLIGEAGLGKSRLIAEVRQEWRDQLAATYGGTDPLWRGWSEFVAVSYGASRPYDMLKRQVRTFCGIRETDPPAVVHERLDSLVTLYPSALHERMHRVFGLLLGDTQADTGALGQGEAFQRELRAVIEQMARVQSSAGPVVYVVDDVHWADVASLEAIRNLLPLLSEKPVLFLFAMRPDWSTPGWQLYLESQLEYSEYSTSIYLEPLSSSDSLTLARELLEDANVPERIYELIERKAEGNPFFVEETVRTLLDSGALRREADGFRWQQATEVDQIAELIGLPGNVQALLTARIDQLDPQVRRTMQLAAVIGRSFPRRVLERISERPGDLLDEHLKRLAQADLVRPSLSGAESEYAFRHALTRDAAYETILLRQRRRYHRRVAEAIESLFADRLTDEAPQLAYHFYEGRDWAKALHYYGLAGESAARLYANSEAIEHYRKALEIALANPAAVDDDTLVQLFHNLGRVYKVAGHYEEALGTYKRLENLGHDRGNPTLELEGVLPQIVIHVTPTSHMNAALGRELIARVMALGESSRRPDAQARGQWCTMLLYMNVEPDAYKAVEHGEQALALVRAHGYKEIEAYVLNDIARAYGTVGRSDEAFAAFAQARQLWEHAGNEPMMADSLGMAGTGYILYGELDQAAALSRRGLEISQRIGNQWGMSLNAYTLGYVLLEYGEISEAVRMLEAAAEWAAAANFMGTQATIPIVLSWVFGRLGAPDYRLAWREEMIAKSRAGQDTPEILSLWQIIARLNAADIDGAVETARRMAIPSLMASGQEAIFTGLVLATVFAAAGHYEEALATTGRMLQTMDDIHLRAMRGDLLTVRGKALAGMGRLEEARAAWLAALEEAEGQGARRVRWPALVALHDTAADPAEKERYRQEAAVVLRFIADHLEEPELCQAFLAIPDIQRILGGDE